VIRHVTLAGNQAEGGGAIYCATGSSPTVTHVTFAENSAKHGAAIAAASGSAPILDRCIIADHHGGPAIYAQTDGSNVAVSCCILWENEVSDYGGVASEKMDLRNNVSEDPQFMGPERMDFTPGPDSPALNLPNCGSIGSRYARIPEYRSAQEGEQEHEHPHHHY
jgi:predicted outer membrane repeat protein